jgi:hypothetical protein
VIGRLVACIIALVPAAVPAAAAQLQVAGEIQFTSLAHPVPPRDTLVYPARSRIDVFFNEVERGRSYAARLVVRDGGGQTAVDEQWTYAPATREIALWRAFAVPAGHAPGAWRLSLYIDGELVSEKTVTAVHRPPPPKPTPTLPPLELLSATVSAAVTRSGEAYSPLQTVQTGSGFFYVVRARGFVPEKTYKVSFEVHDGANHRFRSGLSEHIARGTEDWLFFAIAAEPPPAPGTWRLRLEVDERLLAETSIPATPGPRKTDPPESERLLLAGAAILLLLTLLYVGYHLVAFGRGPLQVVPTARSGAGPAGPLLALVAANLVPLAFLFAGWASAANLLLLYWIESVVVGMYAILRMRHARVEPATWSACTGFALTYGTMAAFYLLFVAGLMQRDPSLPISPHGMIDARFADRFELPFGWLWTVVPLALVPQVAALAWSHGIAFVHHYLRGGEYLLARAGDEMKRPIDRMAPLHIGIVLGGFVTVSSGEAHSTAVLVVLVLAKTIADAGLHLRAHRPRPPAASPRSR